MTFLTLEDGSVIIPEPGGVQAQEYLQWGEIPNYFEMGDSPVPDWEIITSFIPQENQSVTRLLEEYSELALLPFFFDI